MVLGGILGLKRAPLGPNFMNSKDLPEFVSQFSPRRDCRLNLVLARNYLPLAERASDIPMYIYGVYNL